MHHPKRGTGVLGERQVGVRNDPMVYGKQKAKIQGKEEN